MALEFDLIDSFFTPLSQGLSESEVGIGDDGAVLNMPENHQLVVVTDTLVSGVHFPEKTSAYDIAWKALAVNLSDLAAMGAEPCGFSLALTLPENDPVWLEAFSAGLRNLSERFKIPLIGGDTTKGPLTITVTAQGWVPNQQAVLRSGAKEGDLVCVTGILGEGALGLKVALGLRDESFANIEFSTAEKDQALKALNRPNSQLAIAPNLRGLANSAIDISDGLLADLNHMLKQSTVRSYASKNRELGAEIELTQLPLSSAVKRYVDCTGDWSLPLSGGDDYQLCMTLDEEAYSKLKVLLKEKDVALTIVGRIVGQKGIRCLNRGVLLADDRTQKSGYSHF